MAIVRVHIRRRKPGDDESDYQDGWCGRHHRQTYKTHPASGPPRIVDLCRNAYICRKPLPSDRLQCWGCEQKGWE